MLGESDRHPVSPKTKPTHRKKDEKEKTVDDKNGAPSQGQ